MASRPPLADRILAASRPLAPLPVSLKPRLEPVPGLRAVIFDLYGTLFISASGDLAQQQPQRHEHALRELLARRGWKFPAHRELTVEWQEAIRTEHRRAKETGIPYPEIDVREIWRGVLRGFSPSDRDLEEIVIDWECVANPVWPMPKLQETLQALRDRGVLLGIVSNAQFFTPLLFEAFFGKPAADLGFHPDLCHWSYLERQAKPGRWLFERLVASLARHDIAPFEALYLGNDLRNDVAPAQAVGLHAALFAGDRRSLRLRDQPPPPRVVTALDQLLEL